ncbi:MAG: hypothetical protein U9Q33_10250 [Campylobacterota bacterium]|nr:hypothetical protein [Campylobacterota bacterium]
MKTLITVAIGFFLFAGCAKTINISEYKTPKGLKSLHIPTTYNPTLGIKDINIKSEDFKKAFKDSLILSKFAKITQNSGNLQIDVKVIDDRYIEKYTPRIYLKYRNSKTNDKEKTESKMDCEIKGYWKNSFWSYKIELETLTTVIYKGKEFSFTNEAYTGWHNKDRDFGEDGDEKKDLYKDISKKILNDLANNIMPKATVVSYKNSLTDQNDKIFKINMGSDHGLKSQTRCKVYTYNGKYINNCTVSNNIGVQSSWIVLDKKDKNSEVTLNSRVEFNF